MTVDAGTITWLVVAALLLGALAVVLDRVNFPQKPFRPKRIRPAASGPGRDRTGAHILDDGRPATGQVERVDIPDAGANRLGNGVDTGNNAGNGAGDSSTNGGSTRQ